VRIEDRRWKVEDRRWKVKDRRWKVEDRTMIFNAILDPRSSTLDIL